MSSPGEIDHSDKHPDFCPEDPETAGPNVQCLSLFHQSAEISALIQTDSKSDSSPPEKRQKS